MIASLSRRALVGLALLFAGATASHGQEDGTAEPSRATKAEKLAVVANAIDGFIRPGYARFHDHATAAASAMNGLCSEPGDTALQDARDRFAALAKSWSRIEFVRFGPVMDDLAAIRPVPS